MPLREAVSCDCVLKGNHEIGGAGQTQGQTGRTDGQPWEDSHEQLWRHQPR